jgi:hypothetical protein
MLHSHIGALSAAHVTFREIVCGLFQREGMSVSNTVDLTLTVFVY